MAKKKTSKKIAVKQITTEQLVSELGAIMDKMPQANQYAILYSARDVKTVLDRVRFTGVINAISMVTPPATTLVEQAFGGTPCYDVHNRRAHLDVFGSCTLPPTLSQLHQMRTFIGDGVCLEIGAGRGLLAALLRAEGCKMIATDAMSDDASSTFTPAHPLGDFTYMEVLRETAAEAIAAHAADVLLLCWSCGWPTADDLAAFRGRKAIVIGERFNGCTNAGALQPYCNADLTDEWSIHTVIDDWPQWQTYYDVCVFLTKTEK